MAAEFQKIINQAFRAFRGGGASKGPGAGSVVGPALLLLGGVATYKSLFNVEAGHRAVKFNVFSGMVDSVYDEGTHFLVPFIERPVFFNVRTQYTEVQAATPSNDLQTVTLTVRVLTRPDPNALVKIYRTLGVDYADRVLPSIINEVLKGAIARYNASELLTKRAEVSASIRNQLMRRALDFGILIDDVALTQLAFSKEYRDAVERKQIAEQEAGRARFQVEQATQEKRSIELLAQGEAESAKLIGQAMKQNPGFLQLRRIEASKNISKILSTSKNRVFLDSDLLLLNPDKSWTIGK
eukprot:NODE_2475_length_1108_cov_29.834750_g2056_i0.p1 GENE.NODE_2475_length_1108_cov_29.834750_g2056_i0~~NODE_2475_length_1108_cov_29.834750_g2056_i0.p1  ORF type:complete len:297 (+),score=79.03 NODE_2475_length_1108_cov_29.834750_g2056_i0:93-983(+)